MTVDYAEAVLWLWTAPSTIAIVLTCLALQMAFLAAGRPGGSMANGARRKLLIAVPLIGVFLWVFLGVSLAFCLAQAAREDYTVRQVLQITGAGLVAATGSTLVLSAAVFRWAPRRLLARAGVRAPDETEAQQVEEAWALMDGAGRPAVLLVDGTDNECYAVGGTSHSIVISARLFARFTSRERAAVMAHEWGHIRNGDALVNAVGGTVGRVLFFDPVFKVVGPILRRQSEYAADAVSALYGLGPDLASALQRIATGERGAMNRAGGIVGTEDGWRAAHPPLERRVSQLLKVDSPSR